MLEEVHSGEACVPGNCKTPLSLLFLYLVPPPSALGPLIDDLF